MIALLMMSSLEALVCWAISQIGSGFSQPNMRNGWESSGSKQGAVKIILRDGWHGNPGEEKNGLEGLYKSSEAAVCPM